MMKLYKYNILLSDNKPANILLKYEDSYEGMKLHLTDFGGCYF